MMYKHIAALILKEWRTEWRQKYALTGILLHVVSMVFVVFLSVKLLNTPTWNAVFWLILLFSSVSAIARSFITESTGSQLYKYQLASPQSIIVSKLIFNSSLMVVLMLVSFTTYSLVLGNPTQLPMIYGISLLLGGLGLSVVFTFISAVSAKASNSNGLMPVLSFPLILPTLLVAIKASKKAMDGIDISLIYKDLFLLFVLNILLICMSYILFPFLWKD